MGAAARPRGVSVRHAVALFVVLPARALLVGTRAPHAPVRAPAARADFASFEKSFKDELYKQDMLDKNKALRLAEELDAWERDHGLVIPSLDVGIAHGEKARGGALG